MKTALLSLVLLAGLTIPCAMGSAGEPIGAPGRTRPIPPPNTMVLPARPIMPQAGLPIGAPMTAWGGAPGAPSTNLLPAGALEVVSQHDKETAEIRKEARNKIRALRRRLVGSLKELQKRYTQDAKLDEAVAIRNCIRALGDVDPQGRPDPGSLAMYNSYVDRVGFFRVTGANAGAVWGTDTYTTDSSLATAAVHSGALKMGETGLVKVTILPGRESYEGSARNGITSSSWGSYSASYKVERVDDEQDVEGESDLPLLPSPPQVLQIPAMPPGFGPRPWRGFPAVPPVASVTEPAPALPTAGLPEEALIMVDRFQNESDFIQEEGEKKLRRIRREIIVELKPLMTNYAREVKLDSALAVRDYIRGLSETMVKVLPDPGALSSYTLPTRGVLYFRVTGRGGGSVWGTDIYTTDSTLATAAVHSGILKEGQTGVVKVTMLPAQGSYQGTTRNGITTLSYGPFHGSYKIVASDDEEQPER